MVTVILNSVVIMSCVSCSVTLDFFQCSWCLFLTHRRETFYVIVRNFYYKLILLKINNKRI